MSQTITATATLSAATPSTGRTSGTYRMTTNRQPAGVVQLVTGTNAYWVAMREGFALLRRFKLELRKAHCSPLYLQGAWDAETEEYKIEENMQPWYDAEDSLNNVKAHSFALSILRARGIDRAHLEHLDKHLLSRLP